MKAENYTTSIGRKVWDICQNAKIWTDDYLARIEVEDTHLFDRLDIVYERNSHTINGVPQIKGVWVVWYNHLGEENCNLVVLPLDEQKAIYELLMKELPNVK